VAAEQEVQKATEAAKAAREAAERNKAANERAISDASSAAKLVEQRRSVGVTAVNSWSCMYTQLYVTDTILRGLTVGIKDSLYHAMHLPVKEDRVC
jgi:hypothetical protein